MSADGLQIEIRDRVGYLTIDRPERLNALHVPVQEGLIEAVTDMSVDPSVWAVVLTGAGERAFCAGVDLKELAATEGGEGLGSRHPMDGQLKNVFEAVHECRKPTVAVINGWAVGAGCELALACDLRVASDTALIAMPESKRGLAGHFGSQMLPRLVAPGIAYELLYFGEPITSERAHAIGLVNKVVPHAELREFAEWYVRELVSRAPLSVQRYKVSITAGRDLPLSAALRLRDGPDPFVSEDRIEGISAFNEKREPIWRGI